MIYQMLKGVNKNNPIKISPNMILLIWHLMNMTMKNGLKNHHKKVMKKNIVYQPRCYQKVIRRERRRESIKNFNSKQTINQTSNIISTNKS